LSKLPKDWCTKVLKGGKWNDRKTLIDDLNTLATASPRIQTGDFHEVVKSLRLLLSDSMVLIVSAACKALGNLGGGLRGEFRNHALNLLPIILDKLKDKNRGVVEAVHVTLDQWYSSCISMDDASDSIAASLGRSSTPKVRLEVLKWVSRCLPKIKKATQAACLTEPIVGCLNDGVLEVREASYQATASLMTILGQGSVLEKVDEVDLDPKKRKKLLNTYEEMRSPS